MSDEFKEIIKEDEPPMTEIQKSKVTDIYKILSDLNISDCKEILNLSIKHIDYNSKII